MDGITQAGQVDAVNLEASVFVLKKTMQVEQEAALALLNALPQPTASNNPPNLGQNIDVSV